MDLCATAIAIAAANVRVALAAIIPQVVAQPKASCAQSVEGTIFMKISLRAKLILIAALSTIMFSHILTAEGPFCSGLPCYSDSDCGTHCTCGGNKSKGKGICLNH
jgi:hypothetical protein